MGENAMNLSVHIYSDWRLQNIPESLRDLESARAHLLRQFLTLGDFRPGAISAIPRRCGKAACHCAQPDAVGHTQFRLLRKVKGKTVGESFSSPPAFRQAAEQVSEFHRLQALTVQLISINERICRLRPVEPEQSGWTEAEKKRLLLFIGKLRVKSRRFSA